MTPPETLLSLRHSTSHVMAQAVQELFPETKLTIGPPIENGFYYDFDSPHRFVPEDLQKIEARMRQIAEKNHPFICHWKNKAEAGEFLKKRGEPYKLEILDGIADAKVSFYQHDSFIDLCEGPHVDSTERIRHFKLLKVAGSYWRGDEKKKMLQRIYGTVWPSKEELENHLHRLEEANRRDHRKLSKELDLFSIHEEVGAGLIHWHPRGAVVRRIIERSWEDLHAARGYQIVYTPHIASEEIYKTSGHLEAFSENMYSPMEIEERPFRVKPMNCPNHIMIYKTRLRSYREFPIRFAELGAVYRRERAGVLHGLLRVRGFTIDDAHIFTAPEQIEIEVRSAFLLAREFLAQFGFEELAITLSTRPEKFVGDAALWEKAEAALRNVLEKEKVPFVLDEGGGAFYGPKISVEIKDALGRNWQCSTIQLDFNLPERFHLEYVSKDGSRQSPTLIHRALMGAVERFFGILVEHYGGAFPVWLAPVQVMIVAVSEKHEAAARAVLEKLLENGLRAQMPDSSETLSARIRESALMKIPYTLVLGDREVKGNGVALRRLGSKETRDMSLKDFLAQILLEVKNKI